MSTPPALPQLSPNAKSKVAAAAAVSLAGITAWQTATRAGFTWWDVLPVVAVVAGGVATELVPNTPGAPAAKAIVHGALGAVAAVAAALAALVASDPSGVTLVKLAVVGGGSFAVWWIPEAAPQVAAVEAEVGSGAPLAQVLATVAGDVSRLMGPDLPVQPPAPAPGAALAVSPIEAAARAAALNTAPMPAVTPTA